VGVIAVGIYSNYLMIINLIKTFVFQFAGSVSASVGNLIASESEEKSYTVFNSMLLVYFWMYSFCTICFWVMFQPFIEWWIGSEYLLGGATLLLVLVNFYFTGIQECVNTFTNATGLFWETRHKPIFECIINLGVSIALAYKFGIVGVFLGTLASYLCTFWINPVLIFKKQFKKSSLTYFAKFIMYLIIMLAVALLLGEACNLIFDKVSLLYIILRAMICAVVPNIIYLALFWKTKEFKYCYDLIKKTLKRG
jgi:O-antigen/teichoic acid export membrane protein